MLPNNRHCHGTRHSTLTKGIIVENKNFFNSTMIQAKTEKAYFFTHNGASMKELAMLLLLVIKQKMNTLLWHNFSQRQTSARNLINPLSTTGYEIWFWKSKISQQHIESDFLFSFIRNCILCSDSTGCLDLIEELLMLCTKNNNNIVDILVSLEVTYCWHVLSKKKFTFVNMPPTPHW